MATTRMTKVEKDAKLFSALENSGKQYRAMLVARCVELSESGQAVKTDTSGKVSAGKFAEFSEISTNTVKRYLTVWQALAAAGEVTAPEEMKPGVDVELPSRETWTTYYRQVAEAAKQTKAAPAVTEGNITDGSGNAPAAITEKGMAVLADSLESATARAHQLVTEVRDLCTRYPELQDVFSKELGLVEA